MINIPVLTLEDSGMDAIIKMSEGNPGAMTCLMDMMAKQDWFGGTNWLILAMHLDSMGIHGSKLYMLWNDCCDRDLTKLELVLRNHQMGELTTQAIHENLSKGRGTPFENLKSLEELFRDLPR